MCVLASRLYGWKFADKIRNSKENRDKRSIGIGITKSNRALHHIKSCWFKNKRAKTRRKKRIENRKCSMIMTLSWKQSQRAHCKSVVCTFHKISYSISVYCVLNPGRKQTDDIFNVKLCNWITTTQKSVFDAPIERTKWEVTIHTECGWTTESLCDVFFLLWVYVLRFASVLRTGCQNLIK